jgi:hypothetical protein
MNEKAQRREEEVTSLMKIHHHHHHPQILLQVKHWELHQLEVGARMLFHRAERLCTHR